jgi:hypothetical protein
VTGVFLLIVFDKNFTLKSGFTASYRSQECAMSPLTLFPKIAVRPVAMLVVLGTLIFAAGCGSGNGNGAGGGGNGKFTNASLNGQYMLALTGIGVNQTGTGSEPFSEVVVFKADGSGHLSVTVDDFDQSGTSFVLQSPPQSGTYGVNKNGTGVLQFNSSNYGITLIDENHFYVIQGDLFATASGTGEKQDTSAFSSVPSGTFVFQAHNLAVDSRVGSMAISGDNINGLEDFLTLGSSLPNSPTAITGSFQAGLDANGRGQFSLSDGSSFACYMVNSSKFHFMFFSTSSSTLEIGQAEKQTGGPFSIASLGTNSFVFGTSGDTIANPVGIHSAGVLTTDGNGKLTGTVDWEQDTFVNSEISLQNTSFYSLDTNGRGKFNLDLSNGVVNQKIFWMVSPTRAYVLVNSSAAIEDGTFSLQQGAPFSNSSLNAQSSFVMDGFDVAYKDRSGVITPKGNGSLDWNQQANSFDVIQGGLPSSTTTNGTYQVSSNGRVTVVVNNVSNAIVFYLSSSNSGFMVQEDGADIGGAFVTQASQ